MLLLRYVYFQTISISTTSLFPQQPSHLLQHKLYPHAPFPLPSRKHRIQSSSINTLLLSQIFTLHCCCPLIRIYSSFIETHNSLEISSVSFSIGAPTSVLSHYKHLFNSGDSPTEETVMHYSFITNTQGTLNLTSLTFSNSAQKQFIRSFIQTSLHAHLSVNPLALSQFSLTNKPLT